MMSRPASSSTATTPQVLLDEIGDRIFEQRPWIEGEFGEARLAKLRECFSMLELRDEALAVIALRVKTRSLLTRLPELPRHLLLLAGTSSEERTLLYRGTLIRGPCAYLKLRSYGDQPVDGSSNFSANKYMYTTGILLVPASVPLVFIGDKVFEEQVKLGGAQHYHHRVR